MRIAEVVGRYPQTVEVFFKHGLHCIGCPVASSESIADGAKAHGIDLDKLVKDLNKAVKKE
jgi:hybrid cluster-associated redox disulfide protein